MGAFDHDLHRQDPLLHGFVVSNQQSGAGCLRFPDSRQNSKARFQLSVFAEPNVFNQEKDSEY